MQRVQAEGTGVIVLLRETSAPVDWLDQLKSHDESNNSAPKDEGTSKKRSVAPEYLWAYGVGAQILADLGVSKMNLMSAPKSFHGLAGFGLEIAEYVKP
jgi:3,4-dihydroxy 2-butanone 4-phosphate synthase/GTP cyclohydrolase II